MGRSGNCIVYLRPHEEAYVNLLISRSVPLRQRDPEEFGIETAQSTVGAYVQGQAPTPAEVIRRIRRMSVKDRAVMEKATRAFVSYVRAYKEHHCRFIFIFKELDLGRLASAFGLMRLPKMPELKKADMSNFDDPKADVGDVDIDAIKYKDKAREKLRRRKQEEEEELSDKDDVANRGGGTVRKRDADALGSGTKVRRKAASSKTPSQGRGSMPHQKLERPQMKKSERKKQKNQDLIDIDNEYRLLKKLKKKKIDDIQFMEALERM